MSYKILGNIGRNCTILFNIPFIPKNEIIDCANKLKELYPNGEFVMIPNGILAECERSYLNNIDKFIRNELYEKKGVLYNEIVD